ncbi:MAG: type II toxin-antitoxin system Phd/YefM family antitoxin [Thermodesulfovibrionales bacterium]
MNASVVDMRYKMNEVLNALKRRESVNILYHGKVKGVIYPPELIHVIKASEHAFFGIAASHAESVDNIMDKLRGGRYRDI